MPVKKSKLHGNMPDRSSRVLLIIDVINDLEFPEGKKLLTRALPMAKRLVDLKRRVKQAGIPHVVIHFCTERKRDMDVIQLLKKDHKMVRKMFDEYQNLSGRAAQKKTDLVTQITQALTVHAQVEEELVYPAFKENRAMEEQVGEALEEHNVAKTLMSELGEMQPDEERYDAKVKVLSEYVMHHVKEEEKEMFPQAQKRLSTKRLAALGEEVEIRQSELMQGSENDEGQEEENLSDQDMEDLQDMEEDQGTKIGKEKGQRSKRRVA